METAGAFALCASLIRGAPVELLGPDLCVRRTGLECGADGGPSRGFWRRISGGPRGAGGGYVLADRSASFAAAGVESEARVTGERGLCDSAVRGRAPGGGGGGRPAIGEEGEVGPCRSGEGALLPARTHHSSGVSLLEALGSEGTRVVL